jgi:sulfide:quinone oxidoreductase
MSPHSYIKESGLGNDAGYVNVNKHTLQHVKYPNVWSLGDCSSLPSSKTAAAIFAQS